LEVETDMNPSRAPRTLQGECRTLGLSWDNFDLLLTAWTVSAEATFPPLPRSSPGVTERGCLWIFGFSAWLMLGARSDD
jgi:hypothetical protein